MPRFTKEPQEEEEIPLFLEALVISWGHQIPDQNYYKSNSSANSARKNVQRSRHESPVNKTNSSMSDNEEQDSPPSSSSRSSSASSMFRPRSRSSTPETLNPTADQQIEDARARRHDAHRDAALANASTSSNGIRRHR